MYGQFGGTRGETAASSADHTMAEVHLAASGLSQLASPRRRARKSSSVSTPSCRSRCTWSSLSMGARGNHHTDTRGALQKMTAASVAGSSQ